MPALNRDQFMVATELKTERVKVPEISKDAEIIISEFGAFAKERYEGMVFDKQGKLNQSISLRALLIAMTAVDEDGNLLFTLDDVEALGKRSGAVMTRLYKTAERLNKMRPQDIKETAKNS